MPYTIPTSYVRWLVIGVVALLLTAEPASSMLFAAGATPQAAPQATLGAPTMTVITINTSEDLESGNSNHTCTFTQGAIFFPAADGKCTFRRAIREAAARPQSDRPIEIQFNLASDDPNRDLNLDVFVIPIEGTLPELKTDSITNLNGQVLIDGTTQSFARSNGPGIIINTNDNSLQIASEKNIIRGLSFRGGGAIFLKEDENTVENIWMGLTDDGQEISFRTPGDPARMAGGGVFITSNGNIVQNSTISGAFAKAIDIGSNVSNNIIRNNNIGTRANGTVPTLDPSTECSPGLGNWEGGWGIALSGSNNQVTQNRIAGLDNVRSGNDTAPMAIEIFGSGHLISENIIGRDNANNPVGVCGQGIKVSGDGTQIVDNEIVRSRTGFENVNGNPEDTAILANDTSPQFGEITVRRNIIMDGPGEVYKFGPGIPDSLKFFEPAKITSLVGLEVAGTSGDGSPCPNCIIDFYGDNIDDIQEALVYLGEAIADSNGDFTFTLPQTLGVNQAIRTASTTQNGSVIGTYGSGTTTKLSVLYGENAQVITPVVPTPTATSDATAVPANTPTPTPTPTASPAATPTTQPVTVITVNTTTDPSPTDNKLTCAYTRGALFFPGDSQGQICSFRWAWNEAIGRPQAERPIEIRFNIPTSDPNYELSAPGTWVIQIDGTLPGLNPDNGANGLDANGQVYIDGATQPGGRADGPSIIFDTNDNSWEIESENNLITNLSIRGGGAIFLKENNNVVENIWMGLTDDGQEISFREPANPQRMAGGGVFISSDNNIVRGNVISGAFAKAVDINSGNDNNLIVDNYIGTRADGTVPELDQAVQCQRDFFNTLAGNWYGGWGVSLAGTGNKVINNVFAGLHILQSANDTPPMTIELFGADHIIEGNSIGRDSAGNDVGVCGQGIKFSDTGHQIIGNTIVRSRQGFENNLKNAILASDSALGAFGQVTIRENIIIDSPDKIYQFGPGIAESLRFFEPAKITNITGTTVTGTSGEGSPCPGCLIDFYVDDLDEVQESFIFLGSALADSDGNFRYEMTNPLGPNEALRTANTSLVNNVIDGFGPGTTTKFSTLSVPIDTINIDGPTTGDPGETHAYTITVGPSYAGRPISMTISIEGTTPSFITFNEGDNPVRLLEVQWQTGGTKLIDVVAENNMARITNALVVELNGGDPTATSTPNPGTGTAVPSSTPGSSATAQPTSTPSSSETAQPSATPSPAATAQPLATPIPSSTPGGQQEPDALYLPLISG